MKLINRILLSLSFLTVSVSALAEQFPSDEHLLAVCVAVANDDVKAFNTTLDQMSSVVLQVSRQDILDYVLNPANFACNGYDLKQFASQRNASEIASRLGFELLDPALQIAKRD